MKRRSMRSFEADQIQSRVLGMTDDADWKRAFGRTDVVIEAVFEDMGLKHKVVRHFENHYYCLPCTHFIPAHAQLVFDSVRRLPQIKEIEPTLPPHAVFASNTSALPITELASTCIPSKPNSPFPIR